MLLKIHLKIFLIIKIKYIFILTPCLYKTIYIIKLLIIEYSNGW